MTTSIFARRALLSAALTVSLAGLASAHATLETQTTASGAGYKGVMRVGHGCDGQATLKLRITIPEGVISVKPMPKPGWTLETVQSDYAQTYAYYGREVSSGVTEIIWTGELLDAHYDEFIFRSTVAATVAPETVLYFPTVQECADGQRAWIEIPAEGQDRHDLKGPAPILNIIAPTHKGH